MDMQDNNNAAPGSIWAQMGFIEWLTLVFPVTFIVIGVGIISGLFFVRGNAVISEPVRLISGIALCLWGIVRIVMLFTRLKRRIREN
jgi:hypothetical protein